MRTALVGMRMAEELHLCAADRSALFYALLLKDVGCSSNAAKISYLFGADDHRVKHSIRMTNWTNAGENLKNCWHKYAGRLDARQADADGGARAQRHEGGQEAIANALRARCHDHAHARLPEPTARAILDLDEHWDGRGHPCGRRQDEISLLGRICCLAQTVELFFTTQGMTAARDVARERCGTWFDPELVDVVEAIHSDVSFWSRLSSPDLPAELGRWEPADEQLVADDACLDRVAEAFANVVDAKSPWTYQHSIRVADIAVGIARQFSCGGDLLRDLRRALLHDIGKLGVSNLILDKPSKPNDDELAQIRKHPDYSQQILEKVEAFAVPAEVAGASRTARRPRLSSAVARGRASVGDTRPHGGGRVRSANGPPAVSRGPLLVAGPTDHVRRCRNGLRSRLLARPGAVVRSGRNALARRRAIAGRRPVVGRALRRGRVTRRGM